MQAARPVHALPTEVVAKLRSSVSTPSLALCVEELVANSLDAKATCVAVRVDLGSLRLQVVDNGHGIPSEDLNCIGQRYVTSKCYCLEDLKSISYLGYHGEFLANLRVISSVLEVVSRSKCEGKTFSKLFRRGELCEICLAKEKRPTHGTTVTAYNVYYNLPVRQKNVNVALDLERIRKSLEAFAIIHHHVSFSFRDDNSGTKLVQTHSTQSIKSAFGFLFGHVKSKTLREVNNSHKKFTVKGYFGIECHINNHLQYIYINKRAVLRTKIHKLVKRCLSQSLLFKSQKCKRDPESPVSTDFLSLCDRSSPRRGCGEFAVYVLDIRCLRTEYDVLPDTSQTFLEFHDWAGISTCIEQAVKQFLVQENLNQINNGQEDKTANDGNQSAEDSSEDILDEAMVPTSPVPPSSLEKLQKYGYNITTKNCPNNLQSKLVTRSHLSRKRTKDDKLEMDSYSCSRNDSSRGVPEDKNQELREEEPGREGSSKNEKTSLVSKGLCSPLDLERQEDSGPLSADEYSGSSWGRGHLDRPHHQEEKKKKSQEDAVEKDNVMLHTVALKRQQEVGSSDALPHYHSSTECKDTSTSKVYISSLQRFKEGLKSSPGNISVNLASRISHTLSESQGRGTIFSTSTCSKRKTLSISELRTRWFPTFEQDVIEEGIGGNSSKAQNRRQSYPLSKEVESKFDEVEMDGPSNEEGVDEKKPKEKEFCEINSKSAVSVTQPSLTERSLTLFDSSVDVENENNTSQEGLQNSVRAASYKLVSEVSKESCMVSQPVESMLMSDTLSTCSGGFQHACNKQHISAPDSLGRKAPMISSPNGHCKRNVTFSSNLLETHPSNANSSKQPSSELSSCDQVISPSIGNFMERSPKMIATKAEMVALKGQQGVGSSDALPNYHSSAECKDTPTSNLYISSLHRFKEGLKSSPGNISVNLASRISHALSYSHPRGTIFSTTKCSKRKTLSISEMRSRWSPTFEQDVKGEGIGGNSSKAKNRRRSYPLSQKLALLHACRSKEVESKFDEIEMGGPSNEERVGFEENVNNHSSSPPVGGDIGEDNSEVGRNVGCQTSFPTDGKQLPCVAEVRLPHLDQSVTSNKVKLQNPSDRETSLPYKHGEFVKLSVLPSKVETNQCARRSLPLIQRRNFHQDFVFLDQSFRNHHHSNSNSLSAKRSMPDESDIPQLAKHKLIRNCPREHSHAKRSMLDEADVPQLAKHKLIRNYPREHSKQSMLDESDVPQLAKHQLVRNGSRDYLKSKQCSFMSTSNFVLTARDILPQTDMSEPAHSSEYTVRGKDYQRNHAPTDPREFRHHKTGLESAATRQQSHTKQVHGSKTFFNDIGRSRQADFHRKLVSEVVSSCAGNRHLDQVGFDSMVGNFDCIKEDSFVSKGEEQPEERKLYPYEHLAISEKKHQELLAMLDSSPFCSLPPKRRNTVTSLSMSGQSEPSQGQVSEIHLQEKVLATQPFDVRSVLERGKYPVSESISDKERQLSDGASTGSNTQPFELLSPVKTLLSSPPRQMELDRESESLISGNGATSTDKVAMKCKSDFNGNHSEIDEEETPVVSSQLSQRTLDDLKTLSEEEICLLTVIEESSESLPTIKKKNIKGQSDIDDDLDHGPHGGTGDGLDFLCHGSKPVEFPGVELVTQKVDESSTMHTRTENETFALEREIAKPSAPGAGGDQSYPDVGIMNETKDASGADIDKVQNTKPAPKFIKHSTKELVPFYERNHGEGNRNGEKKEESLTEQTKQELVAARRNMPRDTSGQPFSWELYWLLPKSAKPFFPHSLQERQRSYIDGDGGTGVEKLISQHISSKDEEDRQLKWKDGVPAIDLDSSKSVDELFNNWQNPVFEPAASEILNTSTTQTLAATVKVHNSLHPYQFTKDIFASIQVIGQVDKKFIACRAHPSVRRSSAGEPSLLILVDQHAAHERIRIERLIRDAYYQESDSEEGEKIDGGGCTSGSYLRSSSVIPPIPIDITEEESRLAQAFSDKLERLGLSVVVKKNGKSQRTEVTRLPACLVEREANMVKKAKQPVATDLVESLVQESIHLLQETAGSSTVLPKTIIKALNSQACRGAIKFGDALNMEDMMHLLSQLSECNLPFQCAHGRPSIIPLLDLDHLIKKLNPQESRKPNLAKFSSKMSKSLD